MFVKTSRTEPSCLYFWSSLFLYFETDILTREGLLKYSSWITVTIFECKSHTLLSFKKVSLDPCVGRKYNRRRLNNCLTLSSVPTRHNNGAFFPQNSANVKTMAVREAKILLKTQRRYSFKLVENLPLCKEWHTLWRIVYFVKNRSIVKNGTP